MCICNLSSCIENLYNLQGFQTSKTPHDAGHLSIKAASQAYRAGRAVGLTTDLLSADPVSPCCSSCRPLSHLSPASVSTYTNKDLCGQTKNFLDQLPTRYDISWDQLAYLQWCGQVHKGKTNAMIAKQTGKKIHQTEINTVHCHRYCHGQS